MKNVRSWKFLGNTDDNLDASWLSNKDEDTKPEVDSNQKARATAAMRTITEGGTTADANAWRSRTPSTSIACSNLGASVSRVFAVRQAGAWNTVDIVREHDHRHAGVRQPLAGNGPPARTSRRRRAASEP